jgi:hypothetical protein
MWKKTDDWRPGRVNTASGGFGVQCSETKDLGYAKPKDVHQEKLASDLAKTMGLPVPEIRLDQVDGSNVLHAVSVAFGNESIDLKKIRETSGITPQIQAALARASGLLALHAWFATGDLKEEHVLVASDDQGAQSVAAIDFASAFAWGADGGAVNGPTTEPKGLVDNVDKAAVQATVERIEGMTDAEVQRAVISIPEAVLPLTDKDRIINGLIKRRGSIRQAMKDRGWLP